MDFSLMGNSEFFYAMPIPRDQNYTYEKHACPSAWNALSNNLKTSYVWRWHFKVSELHSLTYLHSFLKARKT